MKYIDTLLDTITFIAKAIMGSLLAIMLLVSIVEVIRRYFFNASFPWSEEIVRFMLVWVSFLGGAVAYRRGGLVFFGLLLNKLSPKMQTILNLLTNTSVLFFCTYMLQRAWTYTFTSSVSKQIAIGLGIPMSIPYFGISVGLILFILYSLDNYRRLLPKMLERG